MKDMLQGTAVSGGIAFGKVITMENSTEILPPDKPIKIVAAGELRRFEKAVSVARQELAELKENLSEAGRDLPEIIEAQVIFLDDPLFGGSIKETISQQKVKAEAAIDMVREKLEQKFMGLGDKVFIDRLTDIEDLSNRLICNLTGRKFISNLAIPSVLVAKRIFPSQLADIFNGKILGIAAEEGGTASHVAIMARGLGIPAVLGVKDLISNVNEGDSIIIDGYRGEVHIEPSENLMAEYRRYQQEEIRSIEKTDAGSQGLAITKDNVELTLNANVFSPEAAKKAFENGASGIGLVRTELIFETLKQWPNEEEQLAIYQSIIKNAPGLPVTIRTLDIGGDKQLPYTRLPYEENPFLGVRGVRFSLERAEILKTQLRAILRAGSYGKVRILVPMISDISEIRRFNEILNEAKNSLVKAKMDFDDNMETGIMVEVPSAALTIDILASEVDFFSIGSNDLVQYTLAVDRNNHNVAKLYDPLHPSILRLIDQVVSDAQTEGKKVSVCGEMAGDKDAILILLGLGVKELSINPEQIPGIREMCSNIEMGTLEQEVANLIERNSAAEIRQGLARFKEDYFSNT